MKELFDNAGFVALVGTMFGGAGLEIIRRFMDRRQKKSDEASKMRAELKVDIENLRKQLTEAEGKESRLEAEIERWKGLYYDQKEEMLVKIAELQEFKLQLSNYQHQFNPLNTAVTDATAQAAGDARDLADGESK